jgi:hypothetical protein
VNFGSRSRFLPFQLRFCHLLEILESLLKPGEGVLLLQTLGLRPVV